MFFYRHSIYFCHSSLSRWREAFLPAFLLSCACALALAQPTASAPPLSLQPGQSVTLPLRVTEVNTFHLHLAANEFVHLEVKKQDAARQTAWGANLFRPDQQTTFLLQKNTTRDDPQGEVKMVTEQAGQHRLVIHWGGQSAPDARFTLTVRAWRQATEADRKLIQTVKAEGKIYLRYDEQTAAALQDVTQQAPPVAAALEGFGEWGLVGKVNYYLGLTYHDLGEYRQALACYQRAQALQQRANDKHEEAVAVVSMGEAYQKQSRFQEALDAYTHSIQLWDQAPPRKVAGLRGWPLLNIASVYVSLGETELARNYLQQAAANYELDSLTERERNRGRAGIQARLGHLQSLAGNWESAITYYEQAVALMKRYEGSTFYGRYYARLGEAYAAVGKSQLAEDTLKEGVRIWQGVNDPYMQAGALTSLGKFYLQQKDFEAAARCLQQALAFQQSLQDRRGQAETLYQLSQMERARQAIPQAANYIAQAVGLIEDVRVGLTDTELRTSFLATVQDYYALQLDLLMHLHQQAPQAGYELAAWQVSERAKARGLLDVLYESRTDIRNGVAPNLLAHEQELRQTINEKSGWLTQLLRQRESAQQTETVRNELKLLRAEYEQALARIRAASPRYAALTHPQPVSLADLQHALDTDSVLLEFALGDQQSYLWVISPQAVQSYALPARAQIEATARRAYDALTAHMRRRANETLWQQEARLAQADRAYAQEAATLSQLLFSKLPAPLKARRLLVVADGALHYLPFAALPALTNATTTTAHRATQHFTTPRLSERPRFLLEEYEIVQLPSATTLVALREAEKQRAPATKEIAIFADPVFDAHDPRVKGQAVAAVTTPVSTKLAQSLRSAGIAEAGGTIPRLLFTGREAEAISQLVPPTQQLKATGFAANRQQASAPELANYRRLHFATHGLADNDNPALSAILLSLVDEQGRAQDGMLRLQDIYNLRLNAQLVVISACQTAIGKEVRGEGLLSLSRGFLYAGSQRVISTLWKVEDRATSELMSEFYQALLKPQTFSTAAALRLAQRKLLANPRWQAPRYWAAFIQQGDW